LPDASLGTLIQINRAIAIRARLEEDCRDEG